MTRSQWEANRRQRVSPDRDAEINLKLESLGVSDSGLFDIVFRQNYISRDYQDTVRKRLFLLRRQMAKSGRKKFCPDARGRLDFKRGRLGKAFISRWRISRTKHRINHGFHLKHVTVGV